MGETQRDLAVNAAAARRRSWLEPRVRFAWLVALTLLGASIAFTATEVPNWFRESRLVRHGEPVKARIYNGGDRRKNALVQMDSTVDLEYEHQGKVHKVSGLLPVREGAPRTGELIDILVDPDRPEVWTNRHTPPPITEYLIAPLLLLAMAGATVAVAAALRHRLLALWRSGEEREAVVVGVRQTPLAPLSKQVDCVLAEGRDKRVISVYVPGRHGRIAKGDTVRLVVRPENPRRAIAVAAFQ